MELIEIDKKGKLQAEITLKFADTEKKYKFNYSDGEIFTVDFPEDLRKILRLLPSSITHRLVENIEDYMVSNIKIFPFEMEVEKEILQLV